MLISTETDSFVAGINMNFYISFDYQMYLRLKKENGDLVIYYASALS